MLIHGIVKTDSGNEIVIYGSNKPIKIINKKCRLGDAEEPAFYYRHTTFYISEFTRIKNNIWEPEPPEWMKEYDAYLNISVYTGILIKYVDDKILAYTYVV